MSGPAEAFPRPVILRDVALGPLVLQNEPSAMACRADTGSFKLTHIRSVSPAGAEDKLEVHPLPADGREGWPLIEGPALYAGPLMHHFGHMVAEGIHRLWPAALLPGLRDARIVYQGKDDAVMPDWLPPLLELCAVDPARVLLVTEPTRFAELHVPEQGRVLGGEIMLPGYERIFPLVPLAPPPPGSATRLYISRSRHIYSGSFLGESLIDRVLAEAGFDILHPETMPPRALVERLAAADTIVFAEGSAIHNLELCGPVDARVLVLGRRGGTERHFGRLLDSLVREWRIHPGIRATICLDWETGTDQPRRGRGCSLPDLRAMLAAIGQFVGIELPAPEQGAIDEAVRADLLRFLLAPMAGVSSNDEQLGRALRAIRADPEIMRLIA